MANNENLDPGSAVRLNKYLALQLGVSRREADDLIASGRVKVNGNIASIGNKIQPTDSVVANGKDISSPVDLTYILLNKPSGFVCSRRRQGKTPTIYELIPEKLHHLKPVGRLDGNSSGLILLTNDGDFAYKMTHPKFSKTKIYKLRLDKDLEPLHQQMISDFGVQLEDGPSQLGLERLSDTNRLEWQATMSEGRNRQIRRTFAALGYEVIKLHRTDFGNYTIGDIKPGKYKFVDIR